MRRSLNLRYIVLAAVVLLSGCASQSRPGASTTAPRGAATLVSYGREELKADHIESAASLFSKALTMDPHNGDAQMGAGEAALRAGKAEDALHWFGQAETQAGYESRALMGEASAQAALDNVDAAVTLLRRCVDLAPHDADAWVALARIYESRSQWADANKAYLAAINAQPTAQSYNDYGVCLFGQHRNAEAREQFLKALDQDPALAEAQNNLRLTYAWEGNYQEAMMQVPAAEKPQVLNNIGVVAMERGDTRNAELFFAEAIRTSPTYYKKAVENLQALKAARGASAP